MCRAVPNSVGFDTIKPKIYYTDVTNITELQGHSKRYCCARSDSIRD